MGYQLRCNARNVIYPLELDIVVPEAMVAIEFNGDYWHSQQFFERQGRNAHEYHALKRELCEEKGYQLAFVWEDDWTKHRKEVEAALAAFISSNGAECSPLLLRLDSHYDARVAKS